METIFRSSASSTSHVTDSIEADHPCQMTQHRLTSAQYWDGTGARGTCPEVMHHPQLFVWASEPRIRTSGDGTHHGMFTSGTVYWPTTIWHPVSLIAVETSRNHTCGSMMVGRHRCFPLDTPLHLSEGPTHIWTVETPPSMARCFETHVAMFRFRVWKRYVAGAAW